jgi:chromosome segregation ATPase
MLSEDKSNLEKAQIQKNNNSLKVINDIYISLQEDFKNIQTNLEEKTKTNKKLYEDFTNLYFYLDKESQFVSKLKKEKMLYDESHQEFINETQNFDKSIQALNYQRNEYLKQLEFLTQQTKILDNQIIEEEKQIALLELEKKNLKEQNNEMITINKEKTKEIKKNSYDINYIQNQLVISNNNINKMLETLNELDNRYQKLKEQYEKCSEDKKNLEKKKFNNDKIYQEIVADVKQKENYINHNIEELDKISIEKDELSKYNSNINEYLEKYQNHIYTLSNQNEKLVKELEKFKRIELMISAYLKNRKIEENKLNKELRFVDNKIGTELKNIMNKEKEDEENITNKNEINHNSEIINNMPININEYDYQNENDNFNNRIRELNYYPNNNIDYINYNNNIMPIEQNQEINNEDNYNYSGFQNELELEQNYE